MNQQRIVISTNQGTRGGIVADRLRRHALDVVVATPGRPTVRAARQLRPVLVLVDADHVNGVGTVLQVRRAENPPVVIALADEASSPQVDGCILAGAQDVLVWGQPDELAAAIAVRVDGVPVDRRPAVSQRRRQALGSLAVQQMRSGQLVGSQR